MAWVFDHCGLCIASDVPQPHTLQLDRADADNAMLALRRAVPLCPPQPIASLGASPDERRNNSNPTSAVSSPAMPRARSGISLLTEDGVLRGIGHTKPMYSMNASASSGALLGNSEGADTNASLIGAQYLPSSVVIETTTRTVTVTSSESHVTVVAEELPTAT